LNRAFKGVGNFGLGNFNSHLKGPIGGLGRNLRNLGIHYFHNWLFSIPERLDLFLKIIPF